MKTLIALLSVLLTTIPLFGKEDVNYAEVEPQTILKAIARLMEFPVGEHASVDSALIVNYADASPDISISLSKKRLPWLTIDDLPEEGLLLSAAYVAGNVHRQIELRRAVDSPESGETYALQMYQSLRRLDRLPKIEVLEARIKDRERDASEQAAPRE